MDELKEKLKALWEKVVENKETVVKIGLAVSGAVVGAIVTAVLINAQDNLVEEVTMGPEDEDDE